jgi:hypothetical protein
MDILASVFFVVAAGWLLIALMYAVLAMTFLRIRARGNLDSIYEEDFGRVRLFGNVHLNFGWLLRRYIQHMMRGDRPASVAGLTRFMTREERRVAMEVLLGIEPIVQRGKLQKGSLSHVDSAPEKDLDLEAPSSPIAADSSAGALDENPTCSICLGDYEDADESSGAIFQSKTCPHRFHSECILDWLQRQANLECPCCRFPMVDEENVWKTVKRIRKERRKQLKKERRAQRRKQGGVVEAHPTEVPERTESSSSSSSSTDDSEFDAEAVVMESLSLRSSSSSSTAGAELESQIERQPPTTPSSASNSGDGVDDRFITL